MKTFQQRANDVIAQGCCTYSKRDDSQYIKGVYPTHCDYGIGATLYADKKGYVDYVCGLGSNLVNIQNNYSLPTKKEVEVAEMIRERIPFIEKMKFLKTGSEACQAAVRIARASNGKKTGIGSGYHGQLNWCIAAEEPGAGCIHEGYIKLNSLDSVITFFSANISYVIIEPVQLDLKVKKQLLTIRELCTKHNVVLIFDEVITGFRFPKYCASQYLGITPDLICMGKAMANGYPFALVGGGKKIMDTPDYFISSTFAGEESALLAARYTMEVATDKAIRSMWGLGKWFQSHFNKISPKIKIVGYPTRGELQGESPFREVFMQEMCGRGYLFGRAWFITMAHTKDILQKTLNDAAEVMGMINKGKVKLKGAMPKPIFKRN